MFVDPRVNPHPPFVGTRPAPASDPLELTGLTQLCESGQNFHFVKEQMLKLELSDSEQDRFFAAFDDRDGFQNDLRPKQWKGKVVRSPHFGFKERSFGGGLRHDSEAAEIYFERFRRSRLIFIAAVDLGYRVTDLRLLKRLAVDLRKGVVAITRC